MATIIIYYLPNLLSYEKLFLALMLTSFSVEAKKSDQHISIFPAGHEELSWIYKINFIIRKFFLYIHDNSSWRNVYSRQFFIRKWRHRISMTILHEDLSWIFLNEYRWQFFITSLTRWISTHASNKVVLDVTSNR